MQMESLINELDRYISSAEATYLTRSQTKQRARFYLSVKVHKEQLKHRPIVATIGTTQHVLSRWLDYTFQPFNNLLEKLRTLNLPPNAICLKADANKMYTCIETDHGLGCAQTILVRAQTRR